MMQNIKIDVNLSPPVRCYQMYAYPLSVIFKTQKALPWFMSNFINFKSCRHEAEGFEYMDLRYVQPRYELCDCYDYQVISQSAYKKGFLQDVHTLIRDVLKEGHVISFFVDEYYITNRIRYQKEHKRHLIMVCGCNEHNRTYDVIGYGANYNFVRTQVAFDVLDEAFNQYDIIDNDKDNMTIMGLKDSRESIDMNLNLLRKELEEYLGCTNTYCPEVAQYYYKKEFKFGLDIYNDIKYFLSIPQYQLENYPMFFMIYEHKKNFLFRMKYLQKTLGIDLESIIKDYTIVEQMANHSLHIFLKYYVCKNISRKKELSKKLIRAIDMLIDKEKKELENFLHLINKF
ncbi:hypothetical protein HZI73_05840 [Vallitalea pronyensis]|uniref:Butirosin biosynthesis protein H N-terminal domain-containing protein n=1 Tax=Vallitalea pronyensis TaxID=1348613 RepID=A0A8J8MIG3_9FIRM|nr:hypothetical protein [Vallitalea pronyensis]QUI21848.1 hypothetical protein HZI73_05840 [Vallitalea pronyensis]